jgi:HAD superfamily hydrolase (TIGR01509 family)
MPFRGIIFDLDGTLVDTNWYHVEAWRRAFESFGYHVMAEWIAANVGKGSDQLIPTVVGRNGCEKHGIALRKRYSEEFTAIAERERFGVQPGSVTLLDELHRRGLKTALATSSPKDLLDLILCSAGVDFTKLVDMTTTADDAEKSKPHPDVVLAALQSLDLSARDCVMVGDTPFDAIASRHAGVTCWGVACGGCHSAEEIREVGAAGVWDDPADLLENLNIALDILTR